jgi:ABC-type transport system involved in multi-copper enzyme maturation permease subunit
MMTIFIKEIKLLLKDFRLALYLIILLVIAVFSGIVTSRQFDAQQTEYLYQAQKYENELEKNCSKSLWNACDMEHTAIKANLPVSFIAGSALANRPDLAKIDINSLYFGDPFVYYPVKSINPVFDTQHFLRFDLLFIIEVLFPFFIIVLVFNSLSSEKEQGTLRLMLSNHVSRFQIISGKIVAFAIIVLISFALVLILHFFTLLIIGKIALQFLSVTNLMIFMIVSFCYLLFWIILSMLFSVLSNRSPVVITSLLVVWIFFIFIIPALGNVLADRQKIPDTFNLKENHQRIENELFEKEGWRGGNVKANARDNHKVEKSFASAYLKYIEELNRYQYNVSKQRIDKWRKSYVYAGISPSVIYRSIGESLCALGTAREYNFLNALQEYRSALMNFFIKEDLKDEKSFHLAFVQNYMSWKSINPLKVPRFKELQYEALSSLKDNALSFTLLLIEISAVIILLYLRFMRYDPR